MSYPHGLVNALGVHLPVLGNALFQLLMDDLEMYSAVKASFEEAAMAFGKTDNA